MAKHISFQELMTEIQSLLDKDETVQGYLLSQLQATLQSVIKG